MKISIAQVNVHVGNFETNLQKFQSEIIHAKEKGSELIVFPELAISGYPPRDFLDYRHFIEECENTISVLAKSCIGIAAIIGSPTFNTSAEGKRLHNSAYVLVDGAIQNIIHKTLLPTYDIFDEYRYFEPNTIFDCVHIKGQKIALTICEDLWNVDHQKLYKVSPMDELMKQSPDLMINIAASPFDYDQAQERLNVLKWNVNKYKLPLVYVNHVGAQTELIFDGGSLFLNEKAEIVHQLPFFREQISTIDTEERASSLADTSQPKIALIHDALVLGIKDYFTKSGFSKAVLGLSGGIDSAVVAALAAQALGPENVLAVMLPSQYSSDHSIKDAKDLINNIGLQEQLLPIKNIYTSFEKELAELFAEKNADLTEENMQARIRGVLLMAVSNKFGNILLNTSNKSEAAVGYGTLYGDMCGGLSVIGDVYKTQVYELAKYINREKELIPVNTIEKAPSAELRPGQKDSDSLPDYDLLDKVLYNYIELAKGKSELLKLGFDNNLIERVTGLVNRNEYKRYQTPPILRISPKAFGMGRRMPIVAKY
jgi:NAD+ synthase (glutamine-hydrolysing)